MPIMNNDSGNNLIKIKIGSNSTVANLGPLCFSMWYSAVDAGGSAFGNFISNSNNSNAGFEYGQNGNVNQFYFKRFFTSGNVARATNNVINANTMNHVLLNWGGTSNSSSIQMYINGVEATYSSTSNAASNIIASDTAMSLTLMSLPNNSLPMRGTLSEVAIWNTTLGLADINILAKSKLKGLPFQISPSSLVAYWPMDDLAQGVSSGNAVIIMDRSRNQNFGVVQTDSTKRLVGIAERILSYQP